MTDKNDTNTNVRSIQARSIIVATEGPGAQHLIAQLDDEFASMRTHVPTQQPQRSVGCLYYSFAGPPPVSDPILILNGR